MSKHRKLSNPELGRLPSETFKTAPKNPIVLVLDNVRSAHNVGAAFRTADAFRIEKIYLCGITAVPPNKDIRKTALGASESVSWEYHPDTAALMTSLRSDYHCLAVEQTEQSKDLSLYQPESNKAFALVFGHEVKGVSQEVIDRCHEVIEIPQFGTKHSLNISVSVGIVLWGILSKLGFKP